VNQILRSVYIIRIQHTAWPMLWRCKHSVTWCLANGDRLHTTSSVSLC